MNVFNKFTIAMPSCFANCKVYDQFSPGCKTCNVAERCTSKIELDELLNDLPVDPDEVVLKPTTSAHVSNMNVAATVGAAAAKAPALAESNAATLPYAFRAPDERKYEHCTNAALDELLVSLIKHGNLSTPAPCYSAVRNEMCAVHIEMNLRQQRAPRFRPQPRLQRKIGVGGETDLARDRQVIDLHWRAHSSEKPLAPVQDYPGIFENAPFDFEMASRFAQLEWKSQTKVVHLHLSDEMQWEHALLQLPGIRDKWRTIENGDVRGHQVKQTGAPHVESSLRDAMSNAPHLKAHIPGMVLTWKARRVIGDNPKRIANLVALMTGEKPRDASAMRRTLTSLDGYLKAAPKVAKN